jgi:hypothetical protein
MDCQVMMKQLHRSVNATQRPGRGEFVRAQSVLALGREPRPLWPIGPTRGRARAVAARWHRVIGDGAADNRAVAAVCACVDSGGPMPLCTMNQIERQRQCASDNMVRRMRAAQPGKPIEECRA